MAVEIGSVLHVLAHELRTPTGIAQGYLRMLSDNHLTDAAGRMKAIEQAQRALARVHEITQESSRLAAWLERPHDVREERIDVRTLLNRVVDNASVDAQTASHVEPDAADGEIATPDSKALLTALVTLVKATARELRNEPCAIAARAHDRAAIDISIGLEAEFAALGVGPAGPNAGPLSVERGGLGLSLVLAVAVLDTHDATTWTVNGSRGTVGIRLPIDERVHP